MNSSLFYFVRHGETDWNAERRLQGQLDIALNDIGRRQSAQCGSTLRGLIAARRKAPADFAFISSPLSRACETMEILRSGLDLPRDGYAIVVFFLEDLLWSKVAIFNRHTLPGAVASRPKEAKAGR